MDKTKSKSQPKFDHIPNRIDFIHSLLKDKKLQPLIDVKTKSSDNLIGGTVDRSEIHKKDIREICSEKFNVK
jgi:hypothetical protein